MKRTKTTIGLLTLGFIVAVTAVAFAHGGYGGHMDGYAGYGRHMGGYGGYMMGPSYGGWDMMENGSGYGPHMGGYGNRGSLTEKDAAKIDAAKEDFYKGTRELRGKIDEAQIALNNELDRNQPREDKVTALQKQLSQLQAEFDQKALAYRLEMRKILPEGNYGRGFRQGFRGDYCW